MDEWVRNGEEGEPPVEPEVPDVRWRPGEPLVCGRCRATVRAALLEVDVFAAELAREVDGFRPPSKWSRVSGSRPKPAVSPVGDLLEELTGGLLDFEDRARAWLRAPERLVGARSAVARSRAVAWLVERLDSVLVREELMGLVDFALSWRMLLERMVGDEPPAWTPARCGCGERSFRWDVKAGFYVCAACGTHVSEGEASARVEEESPR
ncbi:TFIIB-type zinc finger domain-containing protein [Microtetraspora malaysiensis]|uniref:TFIIB-type zinc finger domain-containing protein n=1 Tax=Microtetraspora malaysiensis TaxID=161358 RepID=UPI003D8A79E0